MIPVQVLFYYHVQKENSHFLLFLPILPDYCEQSHVPMISVVFLRRSGKDI